MTEGHVVLVGLMGTGKTTVGRRLARALHRPFVDADEHAEETRGRSIADIFATDGEAAFRSLEASVLTALLARSEPTVVAAGGGVVVTAANRERLLDPNVTVVWLRASPKFLASRALAKPHRPLLQGDASIVLHRLHDEREPLYAEVADITVDVEELRRGREKPKQAIAEHVAVAVRQHEAERVGA